MRFFRSYYISPWVDTHGTLLLVGGLIPTATKKSNLRLF